MYKPLNSKWSSGILWILFMLLTSNLPGQEKDTLQLSGIEFITDQLENIAQSTDRNLDYSDLLDEYLFYFNNPLNLNGEDVYKLVELHLINQIQFNNLMTYLNQYKQFYSLYELKNIPGFDSQTIINLLPFVSVTTSKERFAIKPRNVFKYGRHQLILRYNQFLEPSTGFLLPKDSAVAHPGSTYLGSPQAFYTRYAFNYQNSIRFGFTLDKDAGELFLNNLLPDSVKSLVGDKVTIFSDFFSAHIYVSDLGFLKNAVVGDYHLEFGQGLTLWSGLAFGKSAEAVQIKRFGKGIRPNTSANENRFFRGGAATIGWKGISLTGFYSNNHVDANLESNSLLEEETISSILETGKHRTINELLTKDAIQVSAFGGRIEYKKSFLNIGITSFQTRLSADIQSGEQLYKQFYFASNQLTNYGTDLNLSFRKVNFFGELSGSNPGGLAGLAGLNAFLNDRFVFTVFYHNYAKDYHNLFANPFAISSTLANEKGVYFGFRALLAKNFSMTGYADHFEFPWLRYGTNSPSIGKDYLLQLNYSVGNDVEMYFRYRYRFQQENFSDVYDYSHLVADVFRNELRFNLSYTVFESIVFKNRIDFVLYQKEFEDQKRGYSIYQDVLYRPDKFPLEITFRYALFNTEGYDSRIYAYENDVLYAFSVPSYFDKGQRIYLMFRYRALKNLNIWLRIARTKFSNRLTVGSGSDEIEGNAKTEIKVQLQLSL
jgi:hypothetical protein